MAMTAVYNHPECGYHPIPELELGKEYIVESVSMDRYFTIIRLEGFATCFNSVNFDFFKDGTPHDIFGDPNYNPYLGWRGYKNGK